jgi:hypothetical protein
LPDLVVLSARAVATGVVSLELAAPGAAVLPHRMAFLDALSALPGGQLGIVPQDEAGLPDLAAAFSALPGGAGAGVGIGRRPERGRGRGL